MLASKPSFAQEWWRRYTINKLGLICLKMLSFLITHISIFLLIIKLEAYFTYPPVFLCHFPWYSRLRTAKNKRHKLLVTKQMGEKQKKKKKRNAKQQNPITCWLCSSKSGIKVSQKASSHTCTTSHYTEGTWMSYNIVMLLAMNMNQL